MPNTTTLLPRRAVMERLGIKSRETIRQRLIDGLLAPPVAAGGRHLRWPSDELDLLIAARVAGAGDDTVREVVRLIVAARGDLNRASVVQPEAAHAV